MVLIVTRRSSRSSWQPTCSFSCRWPPSTRRSSRRACSTTGPLFYVIPLWLVLFSGLAGGGRIPATGRRRSRGCDCRRAPAFPTVLRLHERRPRPGVRGRADRPLGDHRLAWASRPSSPRRFHTTPRARRTPGAGASTASASSRSSVRLLLTAQLGWSAAASWSDIRTHAVSAPERMWLDERVPPAVGGDGSRRCGVRVARFPERDRLYGREFLSAYLTEFFNSSVRRVSPYVGRRPDSLSRGGVTCPTTGAPARPALRSSPTTCLPQPAVRFDGRSVAAGTRAGLVLWEIGGGAVRSHGDRLAASAGYKSAPRVFALAD